MEKKAGFLFWFVVLGMEPEPGEDRKAPPHRVLLYHSEQNEALLTSDHSSGRINVVFPPPFLLQNHLFCLFYARRWFYYSEREKQCKGGNPGRQQERWRKVLPLQIGKEWKQLRRKAEKSPQEPPSPTAQCQNRHQSLSLQLPKCSLFLLPVSHADSSFCSSNCQSFQPHSVCASESRILISYVIRDHSPRKQLGSKTWDTTILQKE